MRAGVLRVHWSVAKRTPRGIARCRAVVGLVRVSDCGDGSPEVIGIFRIEHSYQSVICCHRRQSKQSCAVYNIHVLRQRALPLDWIVASRTNNEPKTTDRSLLGRAAGAVDPA